MFAVVAPQDPEKGSLAVDVAKLPVPTEEQILAVETLNGFRVLHGLGPVLMDRRLNASAALHAGTMAKSKLLSHKQDKTETADALKRSQVFGYDKGVSELVALGMPDSAFAVVTFIDAPYHRRLLLKPGQFDFGCSTEAGFSCFVLGGQVEQQVVISPSHGSEGVPTSWDGREEPDPMRGTGLVAPYGYPLLIAAYGYSGGLVLTQAKLVDASGAAIDCVVKQPQNDPEAKDCVIIVPKKPLKGKTVHTATVKFTVGGEERTDTWSFRTGAAPEPVKSKRKK